MYAGKPPPPSELALVFDSPVNFDTFVRIMVPLDAASGAADSSRAADDTSQHARARLVCEQLNALEADASFVAWPCSETHVQVMCQKACAAKVYKSLLDSQRALGRKMDPPKEAVKMGSMPFLQLKQGLAEALLRQLRTGGWAPLHTPECGQQLLRSDYLAACPGALATAPRVALNMTHEQPGRLFVMLSADTVRYRGLDLAGLLQADLPQEAMKDFAAFLRHPPHLELVNRLLATAEVKPMCCALPTFRSAVVHAVALAAPHEYAFRERWFMSTGQPLPASIGFFVDVGWSDREDCFDAEGLRERLPACCLWSSTGRTVLPASHPDAIPLPDVVSQISGALGGSKFWGGKGGLTLRNWQGGGAAPSCLAFKCEWQTALSLNGEDQNALPNLGTFELPNYTARQPHRAPLPKARLDQYMKPFLEVNKGLDACTVAINKAAAKLPSQVPAARPMITPTFGRRLQPFGAAAPKAATAPKRGLPPKRAAATPPANGGAGQPGSALPPRLPAAARNVKPRTAPPAQLPTIAESDGDLPAADLPMMSSLLDDALQQQAVPVPAATPAAGPPSAPVLKSTPARPSFAKAPSKHPAAAAKQPGVAKAAPAAAGAAAAGDKPKAAARARPKVADMDSAAVKLKVAAAAQSGTLTKLTIPELKCYLKAEGLAIKGKKEELVARVQLQLGGGGLDAAAPVPPHALV